MIRSDSGDLVWSASSQVPLLANERKFGVGEVFFYVTYWCDYEMLWSMQAGEKLVGFQ